MAQLDQGADDDLVRSVCRHPDDERLIDLELVDLQSRQVPQGRIPGAEVVDADLDTKLIEPGEIETRSGGVVHQRGFGDLDGQQSAGDSISVKYFGDERHESGVVHRPGGHIDRHREFDAGVKPFAQLPHRPFKDPHRHRTDQRRTFGDVDEVARRETAEHRVVPADQRLDASDGVVVERAFWLVEQFEFVMLDRAAEVSEQRQSGRAVVIVGGVVERHSAATLLGDIHRHIGMLEEFVEIGSVLRCHRHPDARLNFEGETAHVIRLAEDALESIGHHHRLRRRSNVGQQDAELVAAESGHRVGCSHDVAQPRADGDEHFIAVAVTQGVVDLLESVEVNEQDCRTQRGATR